MPGDHAGLLVEADRTVGIEKIHGFDPFDAVAADAGLAAPVHLAPAPAIFSAAPHHPDALFEVTGRKRANAAHQGLAVKDIDAVDRSRTDHLGAQMHGVAVIGNDRAHLYFGLG